MLPNFSKVAFCFNFIRVDLMSVSSFLMTFGPLNEPITITLY